MNGCIISNSCTNENKLYIGDMPDKLVNCIEIITRMYSEREKEIKLFDCMVRTFVSKICVINYFVEIYSYLTRIILSLERCSLDKERRKAL